METLTYTCFKIQIIIYSNSFTFLIREIDLMPISLTFHGAARSVTGSCIHVKAGTTQLLIDCGTAQDNGADIHSLADRFPFDPAAIDAVILTHGHLDHTGRVPLLVKSGFKGTVYGHYATCVIARIIWEDSLHHASQAFPGYDQFDVNHTIGQCWPIAYNIPMQINDVEFTLQDAGHILGSSHVLFKHANKHIVFSGDIGSEKTPIIRDPFCKWQEGIDAIVIESTYGSRIHKDRTETIDEFERIVKKVIDQRGVLLIPAFAIGRTQEILYHLNTLVEEKRVPAIPVFVDSPMASEVTGIYRSHRDCYDTDAYDKLIKGDNPLMFRGLTFVESALQSTTLRNTSPPFIIVAGSGMCNGGRILGHLEYFISKPQTTVMFVGWQSQGSLGRALVDGALHVTINGKKCSVGANIATLNGFSAHADRKGLLAWAHAIPGAKKKWFVNHGEEQQACSLAEVLQNEFAEEARAVERGCVYEV
jgi:metallo-beta-lactamase family protein